MQRVPAVPANLQLVHFVLLGPPSLRQTCCVLAALVQPAARPFAESIASACCLADLVIGHCLSCLFLSAFASSHARRVSSGSPEPHKHRKEKANDIVALDQNGTLFQMDLNHMVRLAQTDDQGAQRKAAKCCLGQTSSSPSGAFSADATLLHR